MKNKIFNICLIRLITLTVITALVCQNIIWADWNNNSALAPKSDLAEVLRAMEEASAEKRGDPGSGMPGEIRGGAGRPAATKVGTDQSPVPEEVVTAFVRWALVEGAEVTEGENGVKVLTGLKSIELSGFEERGYTVNKVGDAVIFFYNGQKSSDAYVLRDKDGNRYITEAFHSHYANAPSRVQFQEILHEVFEEEWNRQFGDKKIADIRQDEIDMLWDNIFGRLEKSGQTVDEGEKDIYKKVFARANIEEFKITPSSNTAHILAELTEKLATIISERIRDGEDIGGLKELNLTKVNEEVKISDLDQFIGYIKDIPLTDALKRALEALLKDEHIEFDPIFEQYIKEYKGDTNFAVINLAYTEVNIFLQNWHRKRYPLITEKELGSIIEKIMNKWLCIFKDRMLKMLKTLGVPTTIHYSAWKDACRVKDVSVIDGMFYISLDVLNRNLWLILSITEEGEMIFPIDFKAISEVVTYVAYLMAKFARLKGDRNLASALEDPKCRACIQEMIDKLGWGTMLRLFIKNEHHLKATREEIRGFLHDVREGIINDAREFLREGMERKDGPVFGSLEQNREIEENWAKWRDKHKGSLHINSSILALALGREEGVVDWLPLEKDKVVLKKAYPQYRMPEDKGKRPLPVYITMPIDQDLASEAIAVLEDAAEKLPRVRETLINNLIERIRARKVFFGDNFTKAAIALEAGQGEGREHYIAVNHHLYDVLGLRSSSIEGRSMRGIFLASILLGQEAQIYIRCKEGADWDDPEFNSAFIAQSAELQVVTIYRNISDFLKQYGIYVKSLATNAWGPVILRDTADIHANIVNEPFDYHFLEPRLYTILIYKDILRYNAQIDFSEASLGRASLSRIKELLEKIGIRPISIFSDIPPEKVENVVVLPYRKKNGKTKIISNEELMACIRKTYIPTKLGKVVMGRTLGEIVDEGCFSKIVIEVNPQAKKVTARYDIRSMQVSVTVPEIEDAGSWEDYCDRDETPTGERKLIIASYAYINYHNEMVKTWEAIREAGGHIQRGDISSARLAIQRRLAICPVDLELIAYMICELTISQADFGEILNLIYKTLRDHRLYLRAYRGILLNLISKIVDIHSVSSSGNTISVNDILRLGEIAREQFHRHMRDLRMEDEQDRPPHPSLSPMGRGVGARGIEDLLRNRYASRLGVSDGENLLRRQIESGASEDSGREEERQALKITFNSIALSIANLCYDKGHYTAGDEWMEESEIDPREKEFKRLLSKMWMSFVGGQKLEEDEIDKMFKFYENKQKQNPANYTNLHQWANCYYFLWRYKYPDRTQYLEEAEMRYEQCIALLPIHETTIPHIFYYLGLIKYYLGKKDEAFLILGQFYTISPQALIYNMSFMEGDDIYRKLEKGREEKSSKVFKSLESSHTAVNALIENYMEPFIGSEGFGSLSFEDRQKFINMYLSLLRSTKQIEKAYEQAQKWLEELPDIYIDLVDELVRIGILLEKDDEVNGLLRKRFVSDKEKELIYDYAQAITFMAADEPADTIRALNSFIQKYKPEKGEKGDAIRIKTVTNILIERANIYMEMGQFAAARNDWECIQERGWMPAGACYYNIVMAANSDRRCRRMVEEVSKDIDISRYPDTAVARYNEILAEYPHNSAALISKNNILSRQGRFEEVEQEYQRLISVYPDSLEFRKDLAWCALLAENPMAYEYYKQYHESGGDIESIRDRMGKACYLAQQWNEAAEHFTAYFSKVTDNMEINIMLVTCYKEMKMWNKTYDLLIKLFEEKHAEGQFGEVKKKAAGLFISCYRAFLAEEEPDWDKIKKLRGHITVWAQGLGMDKEISEIDEEIESHELEQKKVKTNEERKKVLKQKMKILKRKMHELRMEVMDHDRFAELKREIDELIGFAESEAVEIEEEEILDQAGKYKDELPSLLITAEKRIAIRERQIDELVMEIRGVIDCLWNEEEVEESYIKTLFRRTEELKVQDKDYIKELRKELEAVKKLADEERGRKRREEKLAGLNAQLSQIERRVNNIVTRLQAILPRGRGARKAGINGQGESSATILEEYRAMMAEFLGESSVGNVQKRLVVLAEQNKEDWPEEIVRKVKNLDDYFMAVHENASRVENRDPSEAFDIEIKRAFERMARHPVLSGDNVIIRGDEIRAQLMVLVDGVIEKYRGISGFQLKKQREREVRREADKRISELIAKAEKEEEKREAAAARERELEEQRRIQEYFARKQREEEKQKAIEEVVREWSEMIREAIAINREIREKGSEEEIDFELIRNIGRQLARRLSEQGIELTYEEAFSMRIRILRVFKPSLDDNRPAWEKIWPVVQVFSMGEQDRERAETEVNDCFKRPEIEDIDRQIFAVLNGEGITKEIIKYMNKPVSSVKGLLRKKTDGPPLYDGEVFAEELPKEDPVKCFWIYWRAANEWMSDPKSWVRRLSRTGELLKAGIIKDPKELVMVQIHLLRQIYTDDPENRLNPKSPDYAFKVAATIAREFSGKDYNGGDLKEKKEFMFKLQNMRQKLCPRKESYSKIDADIDSAERHVRRYKGMHRYLTPDETLNLIKLAQGGNPAAMKVLQQAHAITIVEEVNEILKKTTRRRGDVEEHTNNVYNIFARVVFRYGHEPAEEGQDDCYFGVRNDFFYGMHLVNPMFIEYLRKPVSQYVRREVEGEAGGDILLPVHVREQKKSLKGARYQARKDIERVRSIARLIEKRKSESDGERIANISGVEDGEFERIVLKIAKATGLKPLEVLSFLAGYALEELYKTAESELAGRLDIGEEQRPRSFVLLYRMAGMEPMPALVDRLNSALGREPPFESGEVKSAMDEVFGKIIKGKSSRWNRQKPYNLIPCASVVLGKEASEEELGKLGWISRRLKEDSEKRGAVNIYIGYLEKIYDLVLKIGDDNNISDSDIAPIVEYISSISVKNQDKLDKIRLGETKSFDEPVRSGDEDSDTVGERKGGELAGAVGQKNPETIVAEAEAPTAEGVFDLSPEAFEAERRKVIEMLDKLERRMHGVIEELEKIRPQWEEKSARVETLRREIRELEEKLDAIRRQKIEDLGPIVEEMDRIKRELGEKLQALKAEEEREKEGLVAEYDRKMGDAERRGAGIPGGERRAYRRQLEAAIEENIGERAEKAKADCRVSVATKIKEEYRRKRTAAELEHKKAIEALDYEVITLKAKHKDELGNGGLNGKDEGMKGFYPSFPKDIKQKMGSVTFNKELWEILLQVLKALNESELDEKQANGMMEKLLEGLNTAMRRGGASVISLEGGLSIEVNRRSARDLYTLLNKLKKESESYKFHLTRLICTVFMPMSFDSRLWSFIDSNENYIEAVGKGLSVLITRLNGVKEGRKPPLDGFYDKGYGIGEAEIFVEQIAILEDIIRIYRRFLSKERERAAASAEDIRARQARELRDKEEDVRCRKEQEKARYSEEQAQINEGEKREVREREEKRDRTLAELEEEKQERLAGVGPKYEKWKIREAKERVDRERKDILRNLKERYTAGRKELKIEFETQLDDLKERYREEKERIERGLDELVSAIGERETRLGLSKGHDIELVCADIALRREDLDQEHAREERKIEEGRHKEELIREYIARMEQLDKEEAERRRQIEEEYEILGRMKEEMFASEECLTVQKSKKLKQLRELLRQLRSFEARYQELTPEWKNFNRARSIFMDRLGFSSAALEASRKTDRRGLTLEEIGKKYGLTRERVRQIVDRLEIQLMVFDDFDKVKLEDVDFFVALNGGIKRLSSRLEKGDDDGERPETDNLSGFYITRGELLQLLRTVIEAQKEDTIVTKEAAFKCLDIIRLFIVKCQKRGSDGYIIAAEIAQQLIDRLLERSVIDGEIITDFEKRIGEMRIGLLLEGNMGIPVDKLIPYKEHARGKLKRLEERFADDYDPQEEFPCFPASDNCWLSRDEIICLALTRCSNPETGNRVSSLLDEFIDAQDYSYPESKVKEAVDRLVGIAEIEYAKRKSAERPETGGDPANEPDSAV